MAGTNLTRDEAQLRSSILTTQTYDVTLNLAGSSDTTFRAHTVITFDAQEGSTTFVDAIAQSVDAIELNGTEVPTENYSDSRIALPELAAHNTLTIDSTMLYSHTGEGLHRYVDPADDEVYLYSQFEVADARRVFPNFEQPDLKARFTFHVIAPEKWTVVSNSPTPEPTILGDGIAQWDFTPTEKISTYLTAIIAGPYARYQGTPYTSSDGRVIPMDIYSRQSLANYVDGEEIIAITHQGFEFYEANYGHPYPFRKYDQIFAPEYNAGAMENPGAVTIVETYIFRTRPTAYIIDRRKITILHELAHMWFGDLVTMKWWNDLWLNESFAEFMSHLAAASNTDMADPWVTFLTEKVWALSQDQLPSTHPVAAHIRDLEDVLVNFDGITYGKGASVLKQLVAWVGLDEFLAGVRQYIQTYQWSNATLADLLTELEKTSGRDLSSWTTMWLEEAGTTTLSAHVTSNEDGTIASFDINQEAQREGTSLRPHRLAVRGYRLTDAERFEPVVDVELDVDGAQTSVTELIGQPRPDVLLINSHDLAYAKLRMDPDSFDVALHHIGAFAPEDHLDRSVLLFSAYDMLRDGQMSAHRWLPAVLDAVGTETDGTVMRNLLSSVAGAVNLYSAPETRSELRTEVSQRLFDLLDHAQPGSDAQLQYANSAISLAHTEAELSRIAGWLDGVGVPEGFVVDAQVRWTIIRALATDGRITLADIDKEFERDTSSYGQISRAQALGALPDADTHADVWNQITTVGAVSNTTQRNLALGFGSSKPESLVPYARKYFDNAQAQWDHFSVEMASNVLEHAFPLSLAGRTDLGVDIVALGDEWLAAHQDAAPAGVRLVSEQVDGARRAVRAQEADRQQA
ncbi:MAG: aminopeptidase N [Actinomycetaceae bacterium]|nr:aminopeptidase N [Actinomycetaceae bacterium]MDY6083383.1 aminopeptidase N [Actinomycetaceae bacterium]